MFGTKYFSLIPHAGCAGPEGKEVACSLTDYETPLQVEMTEKVLIPRLSLVDMVSYITIINFTSINSS